MRDEPVDVFVYQQFLDHVIGTLGSLSAQYQPVIDLESGQVEYYEALLRITSSQHAPLRPASFLMLMDQFGVMKETTHWMVGLALVQLKIWAGARLFINMAPRLVGDVTFIDHVVNVVSSSGVNPRRLGFEVPHSTIGNDAPAAARWLRDLREAGFLIALDRCSIGDAARLAIDGLPADYVKFVLSPGAAIIDGEIAEFRSLVERFGQDGRRVVAVGIEDEAALAAVRRAGFHCGQGFLLGHPAAMPGAPAVAAE